MRPSARVSRSEFSTRRPPQTLGERENPFDLGDSEILDRYHVVFRQALRAAFSRAILLRFAYHDPVDAVDLVELHVNALARGSEYSYRRSRPESAPRVRRDRPAPRAEPILAAQDRISRRARRVPCGRCRARRRSNHAFAVERERDVAADERGSPGAPFHRRDTRRYPACRPERWRIAVLVRSASGDALRVLRRAARFDQHDIIARRYCVRRSHREPLDRPRHLRRVERDVGLAAHRATQKKSRLQKQPGREAYTFIVIPFRYLSSVLKVTRIYDHKGCASTLLPPSRLNFTQRMRIAQRFLV